MRDPFNSCDSQHTMVVDKMIGSAYSVVKCVADNLKYILHVSKNLDYIVDIAEFKQRLVSAPLTTLGSTILIPLPEGALLVGSEVVNVSVNLKKTTGELYPEKDCPITTVIRNGNIEITLNIGADASFVGATAYCRVSYF